MHREVGLQNSTSAIPATSCNINKMSLDLGLTGIHVLITGAAGGIGFTITQLFAKLGARVSAHYNSSIGQLETIPGIVPVQADVRKEEDVKRLLHEAAEKNGGPVSVLVINHGLWPTNNTRLVDMSLSQWSNTLAINLTGPFLLCRAYMEALKQADDHVKATANIIFIGSTAGKFGEADHADYAATKAALMYGLVPTLKNEIVAIAPRGRVNSVNPGWVATAEKSNILEDVAFVSKALATTPLQKVAQTRDIANQIALIASPTLSGHVNGMNLMVDGGMEGRLLFPPRSA